MPSSTLPDITGSTGVLASAFCPQSPPLITANNVSERPPRPSVAKRPAVDSAPRPSKKKRVIVEEVEEEEEEENGENRDSNQWEDEENGNEEDEDDLSEEEDQEELVEGSDNYEKKLKKRDDR
ncbi:hypothetical protein BGZ75_003177, partial [Mortierella antarctica]